MTITRSPQLNNRRTRATTSQSADNNTASVLPPTAGRRTTKRSAQTVGVAENVHENEENVSQGASENSDGVQKPLKEAEAEGKPETADRDDTAVNDSPSGSPGTKAQAVGKLRDSAYRPFGCVASTSSSITGSSDSGSESAYCRGGPGKPRCGNPVKYGDKGVKCDHCGLWFHALCQKLGEGALKALDEYKDELAWLCDICKVMVSRDKKQNEGSRLQILEDRVNEIGQTVETHMKIIVQSLKEQEKAVYDSTKIVEKSVKDDMKLKASYADMVKGSCESVVKTVSSKIDMLPNLPSRTIQAHSSREISEVFDSFLDKEKRKLNVVVHNLPESEGEALSASDRAQSDQAAFRDLVKECFKLSVHTSRSFRAGMKNADKSRLLIITLENVETKIELLKMAPQLRHHSRWNNIFITPDLTRKEREEGKKLRDELAVRRQAGENNLTIRKGKIVVAVQTPNGAAGAPSNRAAAAGSSAATPAENVDTGRPVTGDTGTSRGGAPPATRITPTQEVSNLETNRN